MKISRLGLVILVALINTELSSAQPQLEQPGYYRTKFGAYDIVALSDGTIPVDIAQLLVAGRPSTLRRGLSSYGLANPVEISINAYLIIGGSKLILVDAGSGDLFKPYGGRLLASLKNAGYHAEDITDILITHVHVDHTGGLAVDETLLFPSAVVHVNQKELSFWNTHERVSANEVSGISANQPAFLAVKPYLRKNKVQTFKGNVEVLPGIITIESSGHTAGHTLFQLRSDKRRLTFIGDLIHVEQIQLADPAMPDKFDFDRIKGSRQRGISYRRLADEGSFIAADHISFPGIGRIVKQGKGFKWIPVPFSVLGRLE